MDDGGDGDTRDGRWVALIRQWGMWMDQSRKTRSKGAGRSSGDTRGERTMRIGSDRWMRVRMVKVSVKRMATFKPGMSKLHTVVAATVAMMRRRVQGWISLLHNEER